MIWRQVKLSQEVGPEDSLAHGSDRELEGKVSVTDGEGTVIGTVT